MALEAMALNWKQRPPESSLLPKRSLIACAAPSFADSVGINGCPAATRKSADACTLLAPGESSNYSTRAGSGCRGQFVSMFLPEAAAVFMIIANAAVVRVPVVPMPMSEFAASPG